MTRPKILFALTSPMSWVFYRGLPRHLRKAGFDSILLSSSGESLENIAKEEGVESISVPMERGISPLKDAVALWKLYWIIRKARPDVVYAATPKAGLLASVAARIAGVDNIVYSLLGLRLETTRGLKRFLMWMSEKISCACADHVVCISPSLCELAIALRLTPREKTVVLAKGGCGVNLDRFTPKSLCSSDVQRLAENLGLAGSAPVIGFVGRFVKDKGIHELLAAFNRLRETFPDLKLLMVGDFEDGDPIDAAARQALLTAPEIICTGFVADPAPYYKLLDVLAIPTYREGFCQASIEAQASAVPVVTTNATGVVDSLVDGVTGFVVPVGDSDALTSAIRKLLDDPKLRAQMGQEGRLRAEQNFGCEAIWNAHLQLYRGLLVIQQSKSVWRKLKIKRAFDFCLATLGLLLLTPLFLVVSLLVRIMLGRPVFFRQQRPGFHGSFFTLFKFRTMNDGCGADGALLPDAERLTGFGRFLRSTSLDEIPELLNVIRGEMSLVGPRPLLPQYLDRYTAEQKRRHLVKPGITGWAQVNGRNALDWEQKLALDVWYVDHQSFALDMRILAKTLRQVLRRDGITQEGHVTMPEFLGRRQEKA